MLKKTSNNNKNIVLFFACFGSKKTINKTSTPANEEVARTALMTRSAERRCHSVVIQIRGWNTIL